VGVPLCTSPVDSDTAGPLCHSHFGSVDDMLHAQMYLYTLNESHFGSLLRS
jgi:hypothetical protein